MSFLFDKKTRNTMRWIWVVFSVMIILSMVLVFSGGSQGAFSPTPARPMPSDEPQFLNAEDIIINSDSASGTGQELEVRTVPISETEPGGGAGVEFEAQL